MTVLSGNDPPHKRRELKFHWITGDFAVCRMPFDAAIPDWATKGAFTSITRTPEELSVICPAENVPQEHKPKIPWICFKLEGPFAFSEVGVLDAFIQPLIENAVPILAIATYDTDYVLVRQDFAGVALGALQNAGHEMVPQDESWRSLIK